MEFREDIGQYVFEYEGLIFAWDEEPEEDIQDTVKTLANKFLPCGFHFLPYDRMLPPP